MNNSTKISLKEKIGYGLGDTASNFYFQMFINFLLFFYTDIFGIPAAAAGTMFLVTRIWDAVNDPMMGVIADRTETRWGKFRPYLIWIVIPIGIFGVLTFTTPNLSVTGKLIYAYVTYTFVMMAYTAINIPYSALMGVISPNSLERTSLSSYRFILAFVGAFIVQGLTLKMVEFFGKGNQAQGFQMAMVVYGILAGILFVVTFLTTRERVIPSQEQQTSLKNDLRDLLNNRPWVVLFFMGIFSLTYVIIRSGSIMYYFKYYLEKEGLAPRFMVLGTIGVIAGVACTEFLTKRLGKIKLYKIVMTISSLLTLAFYFLPKDEIILIFALNILIATIMAPQAPLIWAMYADTADYSEWKNNRRATGLVFSAATFAQKMGIAIGGALAGWLLAWFGFQANVTQTPEALTGIRLMMSIIPAVAGLLAVVAVFFYELDDKLMEKIEADLTARKNANQ